MTSDSMFLSSNELRELTLRTQHAAQLKALRAMGIEHRKRPDGSVVVMRAHVEQIFGSAVQNRIRQPSEPNWGALNATRT